jgi:7,8-dihydropterin-6-yl-methyl-4-(beta-D-ribofuranosyl)aminobenzene 5'-phosphate synthase
LPGFGFSALIFNQLTNKYLLFDTGGDGNILRHNIDQFQLSISDIEYVVISHNHGDHTGGLNLIYEINPKIKIYTPKIS